MLKNISILALRVVQQSNFKEYIERPLIRRLSSKMERSYQQYMQPKRRENPVLTKIDTPELKSILTKELYMLIDIFSKYNYELRIAGGAVRDILMNIHPKDIDLATTATPNEMKKMFEAEGVRLVNCKGEKHGTITARIDNKENFEITTLRIDIATDGRHAEVEFTTDWQLDANRRDLTINSMFLGLDGTLYDYFYGFEDLQARRVVFVGDADSRIKEDFLRILRYFRFYGRISRSANNHDEGTLRAIKSNAEGLARISGERIWTELQKVCVGNFAEDLILEMVECALLRYCGLPITPNIQEFTRLCRALENFDKPHGAILLMSSLLHSYEDAISMHERLKLAAHERDLALFITQNRNAVTVNCETLRDCQILCFQPNIRREFVEQLLKYCNKLDLYNSLRDWNAPRFPINGNMLIERACPAGKKMGAIMNKLKMIWVESDFQFSADVLLNEYYPELLQRMQFSKQPSAKKMRKSENI